MGTTLGNVLLLVGYCVAFLGETWPGLSGPLEILFYYVELLTLNEPVRLFYDATSKLRSTYGSVFTPPSLSDPLSDLVIDNAIKHWKYYQLDVL